VIDVFDGSEVNRKSSLDWVILSLLLTILGLILLVTSGCGGGDSGSGGSSSGPSGGSISPNINGTVSGNITKVNNVALAGVKVSCEAKEYLSSSTGGYTLSEIAYSCTNGNVYKLVKAELVNYQTSKKYVIFSSSTSSVTCNIKLPPDPSAGVPPPGFPPIVSGINIGEGQSGTVVTVSGNTFGNESGVVEVGGIQADTTNWTNIGVIITIPVGLLGEQAVVVFNAVGQKSGNETKFNITP